MKSGAVFSVILFLMTGFSGYAQSVQPFFDFPLPAIEWYDTDCLRTGDFNGDGFDDLVAVVSLHRNKKKEMTGYALIFRGTRQGLSPVAVTTIDGVFPGTTAGISSCTTGDFNCDGFDDLVLGNNLYGIPQLDRGFIQLHYGSRNWFGEAPDLVVEGLTSYGSYGSDLRNIDFNGDGRDDLLVVARFDGLLEGRIYLYPGGHNFQLRSPRFALSVPGSQSLYCSLTGDLNHDGYADVVGRSNLNWNNHQHMLYIFHGGPQADEKADRIIASGIFNPSAVVVSNDPSVIRMIGSVNMNDGRQVTRVATLTPASFTLLPDMVPGSIRNLVKPDIRSNRFFVVTPVRPVGLVLYELPGGSIAPRRILSYTLPGGEVSYLNGMVYADFNGDGRQECLIAYADGKMVKLAKIPSNHWNPE